MTDYKRVSLEEVRQMKDSGQLRPVMDDKDREIYNLRRKVVQLKGKLNKNHGPYLKDARLPRKDEKIGGGFFVVRRGSDTGRIKTVRWMFEHPNVESAIAEEARLKQLHPEETFEILVAM